MTIEGDFQSPAPSVSTHSPEAGEKPASKRGRKKRADLPSPGIRKDTLGVFPVNGLSASALYRGTADAMLGFANDELSIHLKDRRQLRVEVTQKQKQTQETMDLQGRYFNGLADAFYRAQLSQVILVHSPVEDLIPFMDNVLDYLEKLVSLGFFLRRADAVQEYLPCFVVTGDGIVFDQMMKSLEEHLMNISQLDERQRHRVMEHFMRGFYRPALSTGMTSPQVGSAVETCEPPRQMRLAGANQALLEQTQSVLSRHGIVASVENQAFNSVERLELEEAARRFHAVIMPTVANQMKAAERQTTETRLFEAIYRVACQRRAYETIETFPSFAQEAPADATRLLGSGDVMICRMLAFYASVGGHPADRELFDAMEERVVRHLRQQSA